MKCILIAKNNNKANNNLWSGECKRHQCIKEKTIVGQDNDVHA